MKYLTIKVIFSIVILMILAPTVSMAQPAGPGGGGGDPFATPVNGGVAFVAAIAFLYGAFRIYQSTKKNGAKNANR